MRSPAPERILAEAAPPPPSPDQYQATRRRRRARRDWRVPFDILAGGASNFAKDRGTQMAASISYYTLFSLFPLTLLVVSVFGIVLRDDELLTDVVDAIVDFLPVEGDTVETSLRNVAELGPTLTIFSFIGTAWSAAALSASIRSALNVAFDTRTRRPFLRAKLIDYALLPIIGIPLLGGIVVSGAVRLAREEVHRLVPALDEVFWLAWEVASFAVPFLLSFTAFLLIYWLLPNRRQQFRYIWPGAALAALAFEIVKGGFTFYLANFGNYDVIYGSLGSVIILLFWVFITSNILIFGAEVAAEVPKVLYRERIEGRESDEEVDWRHALWHFVLGLVMVVDDESEDRPRRVRAATGGGTGGLALPRSQDPAVTARPAPAADAPVEVDGASEDAGDGEPEPDPSAGEPSTDDSGTARERS